MDRREQVEAARGQLGTPIQRADAEALEQRPHAGAGGHRHRGAHRWRRPRRGEALVASLHLRAHVVYVEVGDGAVRVEQRRGGVGIVGVDVHLERGLIADDQHGVAEPLECRDEAPLLQIAACDREARAVPVSRRGVLRPGDARARLVRDVRSLTTPQGSQDAGQHDRERVAAGVDDARLAQRGKQFGAPPDRGLPCLQCALDHGRDHPVLDLGARVWRQAGRP